MYPSRSWRPPAAVDIPQLIRMHLPTGVPETENPEVDHQVDERIDEADEGVKSLSHSCPPNETEDVVEGAEGHKAAHEKEHKKGPSRRGPSRRRRPPSRGVGGGDDRPSGRG